MLSHITIIKKLRSMCYLFELTYFYLGFIICFALIYYVFIFPHLLSFSWLLQNSRGSDWLMVMKYTPAIMGGYRTYFQWTTACYSRQSTQNSSSLATPIELFAYKKNKRQHQFGQDRTSTWRRHELDESSIMPHPIFQPHIWARFLKARLSSIHFSVWASLVNP